MTEGLLFALLTTLSWSVCIFPFTIAARRMGNNELNHFRLLLATIVMFTLSLIISSGNLFSLFKETPVETWCWFGISGLIGLTIGDYFAFSMYSILGARIGSVLTTFAPAGALVFGALLTNERISFAGIVGIMITIVGVIQISLGKRERILIPDIGYGTVTKGIITGILAALCQGAGLALAKKGFMSAQIEIHPVHATFMRLVIATTGLILLSLITGKLPGVAQRIFHSGKRAMLPGMAGTLFGPVMGVCLSLYTVSILEPSVAQTIFSLVPIGALFISAIFMKERITSRSVTGVVVAIAGVMILIWRDVLS